MADSGRQLKSVDVLDLVVAELSLGAHLDEVDNLLNHSVDVSGIGGDNGEPHARHLPQILIFHFGNGDVEFAPHLRAE